MLIVAVIAAAGWWHVSSNSSSCINVYVDFGSLDNDTKIIKCVETSSEAKALEVLQNAKLSLEGTKKYGDQVVCRVNNLPDARSESCESMPSEKAYWAVILKKKQVIPNPFDVSSKWGWAQTGVADITLKPGDSIGLVFSENGKLRWP